MDDRTQEAIHLLQKHLDQIPALRKAVPYSVDFTRWTINLDIDLSRIFGAKSGFWGSFHKISWRWEGNILFNAWDDLDEVRENYNHKAYIKGFDYAEGILRAAIDQLTQVGLSVIEEERGYLTSTAQRKIFISHGKITPALDKVERYIRVLGFEPIIVGRLPSEGKAVDDLVEERMTECQCVVILATCDDQVEDYYQPRPNVMHEIGLAQEKLGNRIIYLKEKGCSFSSNTQPKVWEDFTQDNLEAAFEKIAKELRAFKLIY